MKYYLHYLSNAMTMQQSIYWDHRVKLSFHVVEQVSFLQDILLIFICFKTSNCSIII